MVEYTIKAYSENAENNHKYNWLYSNSSTVILHNQLCKIYCTIVGLTVTPGVSEIKIIGFQVTS